MYNENVSLFDKIVSIISYITAGWGGIIWQIFCAIKKRPISKFLLFHIYQSIFISVIIAFSIWIFSCFETVINIIPFIRTIVNTIVVFFIYPFIFGFSILKILILFLYLYIFVCCIMGKETKIPFFSSVISTQLERF